MIIVTEKVLDDMVAAIVQEIDPEQIYLFGSRARGRDSRLRREECLKFLYPLLRLTAHPHRKAGATSVIKRSSCSRVHGGRKVGI
jgi:hypothetical protein